MATEIKPTKNRKASAMSTPEKPTQAPAGIPAGAPPTVAAPATITAAAPIAPPLLPAPAKAQEAPKAPPAKAPTLSVVPEAQKPPQEPESEQVLQLDPLLARILGTRRAHGSHGDSVFRLWLFSHLRSMGVDPKIKVEGNILVKVGKGSTTLFSCHVDTVHRVTESDGKPQPISFDPIFGHVFLTDKKNSTCLGGDDGVGIYIMLKMIEAKKEGWYIFHVGEERSGIGSRAFVHAEKEFLDDIEAVVAFDRPVRQAEGPEVIITQGGMPCASQEYGKALADELNKFKFDLPYETSTRGVFTDSKIYAPFVPECVNLGCFYNKQHTSDEYVDVVGVYELTKAAIAIDWGALPIKRKAEGEVVPSKKRNYDQPSWAGLSMPAGYDGELEEEDYSLFGGRSQFGFMPPQPQQPAKVAQTKPPKQAQKLTADTFIALLPELKRKGLTEMCRASPELAAIALVTQLSEIDRLTASIEALHAQVETLSAFMSEG